MTTERDGEPDPSDRADSTRGTHEPQLSRLSAPILLVLVALAMALIVLLVVFGGLT